MGEKINTRDEPLMVTICCLAYNHESYIRQCLDGFLMQKTNFRFEAIVHDDASTDGTATIIREYADKYPNIIKPIFETENQYSKRDGSLRRILDAHTHGKYIAMCEGDDYWTDPYKLQKQVDFLESHPDYVMCSHRFNQYIQDKNLLEEEKDLTFQGADYDLKNLIGGKWLTQTLTVMYRRSALDLKEYESYGMSMDIILFYALLKNGKGYCFPDIMGTYRLHGGGVWSEVSLNQRRLIELKARLAIYNVEHSDMAAMFLLYQFAKAMSRVWILKQWRMIIKVFQILKKHYGGWFVTQMVFDKFVLNRNVEWNTIPDIKMISQK